MGMPLGLSHADKKRGRVQSTPSLVKTGERGSRALGQLLRLRVIRGIDRGRTLELGALKRVRIGSHPSNELCLLDRHVSRFHCEIVLRDQGWVVCDLKSTNGTYLDREPAKEALLHSGARLRVGHTVLEVVSYDDTACGPPDPMDRFGRMVGGSPAMGRVFEALQRVANSSLGCLLLGETGTGKALAARALHERSERSKEPFLVVDCGAVGPQYIEDKLFGHQRGKFTGDAGGAPGVFEEAAGGTVFLERLGELPLAIQPKLLRVLEQGQTTRIGASEPVDLDVRVVAATHRNLMSMVRAGQFRQDLLYRIAEVTIRIPALRERAQDIGALAHALLEEEGFSASLSPDAVAYLQGLPWPGNIRELRNFLRRAAMLAPGPVIERAALQGGDASQLTTLAQPNVGVSMASEAPADPFVEPHEAKSGVESARDASLELPLDAATEAFRRAYVHELKARFGDDLEAAAKHAGLPPELVSQLFGRYAV